MVAGVVLAFVISQNADMVAQLGIPECLKLLLCASFGYSVKEVLAKEYKISDNRV